jgi:hypothetical protein
LAVLAFLTSASSFLAGCTDDEPVDGPLPKLHSNASRPDEAPTPPAGKALVRVVFAVSDAPDAPAAWVGVPRSGASFGGNLMYGRTTKYVAIDAGAHDVVVEVDGARASARLDVRAGTRVTAVATGAVRPTDAAHAFHMLALEERFEPPAAAAATVRFVHASPDAPSFALDVGDDDVTLPEIGTIERDGASRESGVVLPAAEVQLALVSAGRRTTAFTTPRLEPGGEYFMVAVGDGGRRANDPRGLSLVTVGPRGTVSVAKQNPRVRMFHAAPDAPAVALFTGATRIDDTLSFGDLGREVQLPPAAYDVDVFTRTGTAERPQAKPIASLQSGWLEAGESYLAVVAGFAAPGASDPGLRLVMVAEDFATRDSEAAHLRFVNATPDAADLDFATLRKGRMDQVMCADLAFATASAPGGVRLAPQSMVVGVSPRGGLGASPVAAFHTRVELGAAGFVLAAGALDPSRGKALRLFRIDTSGGAWRAESLPEIQPL